VTALVFATAHLQDQSCFIPTTFQEDIKCETEMKGTSEATELPVKNMLLIK
jgi:hypothetical protein